MTAVAANLQVRWIHPQDHCQILGLEKQLFLEPLVEEDLRAVHTNHDITGRIYETRDQCDHLCIAGYMIVHTVKNSYYLARLGVHPELHLQGIGRRILEDLLRKAKQRKLRRLFAFITESDLQALYFLKACGWKAIRLIRGGGQKEDGIEMEVSIG